MGASGSWGHLCQGQGRLSHHDDANVERRRGLREQLQAIVGSRIGLCSQAGIQ